MILSLFFVTNASIFYSDISNIFNNISSLMYRMFRYRLKTYCFGNNLKPRYILNTKKLDQ